MSSSQTRQQIRNEIRARRRQLEFHHHVDLSTSLSRNLFPLPQIRNSRHIALYLSNDGEVDLSSLIDRLQSAGKQCYLPILSPIFHNQLWFAPYHRDSNMVLNRFGIAEPDVNWRYAKPAWALDLILMPLVAFDIQGNRLGMGGGFYDRSLAYLNRRKVWRKPYLMGTAFELQKFIQLPHASWDIPMNGIMTEKQFYPL